MSNHESEQSSSIRAVRPVIASASLRHFIKSADVLLADEGFNFEGGEPLVFAAEMLHSTLFVRRAKAGQRVNELLSKVENYIQSPKHAGIRRGRNWSGGKVVTSQIWRENPLPAILQEVEDLYVPDKERLYFRVTKIVECTKASAAHRGRELALVVEDGPVADMLTAQSAMLNDAAARTNAAKLLPRQDEPDNPLEIPFLRAPFKSDADCAEFIDALSSELPVHEIGLKPISYRHELASS